MLGAAENTVSDVKNAVDVSALAAELDAASPRKILERALALHGDDVAISLQRRRGRAAD